MRGSSGAGITRIGVICHETGHFFGLPDLYDYSSTTDGLGGWCLMAGGSWNGADGESPTHLSAWSKVFLGFAKTVPVHSKTGLSLPRVEDNAVVGMLRDGMSNDEYFLIENRAKVGFDNCPEINPGLLIYHVDQRNANNDLGTWPHPAVKIEEADGNDSLGIGGGGAQAGDAWTSTSGLAGGLRDQTGNTKHQRDDLPDRLALTAAPTTPASYTYNRLNNFSAAGSTMTFDVQSLKTDAPTQSALPATFTVAWAASSEATKYEIQEGSPATLTSFFDGAESADVRCTTTGASHGKTHRVSHQRQPRRLRLLHPASTQLRDRAVVGPAETVQGHDQHRHLVLPPVAHLGGQRLSQVRDLQRQRRHLENTRHRQRVHRPVVAVVRTTTPPSTPPASTPATCAFCVLSWTSRYTSGWVGFPYLGFALDDISITGAEIAGYGGWTTLDNNVTATSYSVSGKTGRRLCLPRPGLCQRRLARLWGRGRNHRARQPSADIFQQSHHRPRCEGSAFPTTYDIGHQVGDEVNDVLTFSKVSGPAWLSVSADGTLSGTPPVGSAGLNTFTVRVTDSGRRLRRRHADHLGQQSPFANWRLNESTGPTLYDSVGSFHGTAVGSLVYTQAGAVASARQLRRPVQRFGHGRLHPGAESEHQHRDDHRIAEAQRHASNQCRYFLLAQHCRVRLTVRRRFDSPNRLAFVWNGSVWTTSLTVPDNQWTFVAAAIGPDGVVVYMATNSTVSSVTFSGTLPAAAFNSTSYIGYDTGGATRRFNGTMDDVAIYGRTLSASEISELAAAAFALAPPIVTLTSPTNGATLTNGTDQFGASVVSNDHSVTAVRFYAGLTLLGEDATVPYSYDWTGMTNGTYTLTAKAIYDGANLVSSLSSTVIEVALAVNTYTLTYVAGANGTLTGTTPQTVNHGGNGTQVTAVPNAGYHFVSWSDGVLTAARTDLNVTADISVTATFAINTYTLTYAAGANGTLTGTSPQTVNYGGNGTQVTAVPNAGYHFVSWSDGVLTAARTDLNVTGNISVTASFAINTYTLTYAAGANGTISGTTPQTVNHGGNGTQVTAVPDAGYHFVSWSDGVLTAARTDLNVTADISVTATFAINTYTLTYAAGANGTISGTTPQTVNHGGNGTQVTAVPNAGYHFVSWSDGVLTAARTDLNVTADISVTATFAINTYTLTYVAGANGAISGTTPQTVNHGGNGTQVTAVPNAGYRFVSWSDGVLTAARTDLNVTADITVTASFASDQRILTVSSTYGGATPGTVTVDSGTPVTQWVTNSPVVNGATQYVCAAAAVVGNVYTQVSPTNVTLTLTNDATLAWQWTTQVWFTAAAEAHGTVTGTANGWHDLGGSVTVTAVPEAGYHFAGWSGDVLPANTNDNPLPLTMDQARSVTAHFAVNTYTLTYVAGANGTLTGTTPQTVNHGGNGTQVTAVPNAGYHFVSWSDGVLTAARTDLNVTADISVTATFAINTYTLTYAAGANGTLTGTSPQTVNYGGNGTQVTAVPNAGYHFVSWSDGVLTAARTDLNVTAQHQRHGELRDQHLHADLCGGGERNDLGHDAPDGQSRRERHAGDGGAERGLPFRELERWGADGSADGPERDGGHLGHGDVRDQHLHADLRGGGKRGDLGHDAPDGQSWRERHAGDGGTERGLPFCELERWGADGSADGPERDGRHYGHGQLRVGSADLDGEFDVWRGDAGDSHGGLRDAGDAVGDQLAGGEWSDAIRLRGGSRGGQRLHAGESDECDVDADQRRDARVAMDHAGLVYGRGGGTRHGDGDGQRLARPGWERDGDGGS